MNQNQQYIVFWHEEIKPAEKEADPWACCSNRCVSSPSYGRVAGSQTHSMQWQKLLNQTLLLSR